MKDTTSWARFKHIAYEEMQMTVPCQSGQYFEQLSCNPYMKSNVKDIVERKRVYDWPPEL